MSEQRQSNLTEIFALWKNTSKSGETYLQGTLGNAKVLVLKNTRKEKESQPDYRVFVAPKERNEDGDNGGNGSRGEEPI